MDIEIKTGLRQVFSTRELLELHAFRTQIFVNQLEWTADTVAGLECDEYDHSETSYMSLRRNGQLFGCWRILPTTGPYMLKNTFKELLYDHPAPDDSQIFELSRFAIENTSRAGGFLSDQALIAMRAVVEFGLNQNISKFVTVTTAGMERLLQGRGLVPKRFGAPRMIGRTRAVALEVELDLNTLAALGMETSHSKRKR